MPVESRHRRSDVISNEGIIRRVRWPLSSMLCLNTEVQKVPDLGINIFERWESWMEGSKFLSGSLAEMSREMSSDDK